MAAGFRHLLVLLGIGLDNALREESGAVLAVKPSSVDAIYKWGMDCPDCIYTGAGLRGGETYRLWGNRGTARYVGLQSMAGMASSANVLLDELDLGPNGEVDLILSAEHHEGNWLRDRRECHGAGDPALLLRLGHGGGVLALHRARSAAKSEKAARPADDPRAVVARQLIALGDFVVANLEFFLQFSRPEKPNTFLPPLDGTAMGAAAENRPVIGSWELAPDEALVVEVAPPQGLYWSYSLGNPWWETIDYGVAPEQPQRAPGGGGRRRHPARGDRRTRIPGVANWLDTAGHSAGPIILRCVRTETAPVPTTRLVKFSDIGSSVPAGARRVTPEERRATLDARRLAVSKRFCR